MDANRSQEANNDASIPAGYARSNDPGAYYNQLDGTVNLESQLPSSIYDSPSEESLPLGGYDMPWHNYLGASFGFPVDNISTSEQLTPEQLAELDEYLNTLSQQNTATIPQFPPTGIYPAANQLSDGIGAGLSHTAETMPPNYSNVPNHWSAGVNLSGNVNFLNNEYHPFGLQNAVFPADENFDQPNFNPQVPISVAENANSKPSFAEVAKTSPTVISKDNGQKNTRSLDSKQDAKVLHSHSAHYQTAQGKTNPIVTKTKKPKSMKLGNVHRSKSVPVEPAEIKPDSRYGLDTFDEKRVEKEVKCALSCGSSRKNSTSSVSSGVDEAHSADATHHFNNNKEKKPQHKKRNTLFDAKPKTKLSNDEEKVYFDPRRIFQDSREKNSQSVQTNNEDFVPNNKQKIQPDKECLLNKEKNKASVKSGSTKYINNDLRDVKKHTNIEQDRDYHVMGQKEQRARSQPSQARNRGKTSKSDSQAKSASKTSPQNEKMQKAKHLIGVWLLLLYDGFMWSSDKALNFFCNLLKLVFSVLVLLLALFAHYSLVFCMKIWCFIKRKVPFLRDSAEEREFDWSSPLSQPRPKQMGLKENIALPATGIEAMKRLLSCKGKDPYSILGVRGDASDEDIKKYYRKQAVLVHPDKNKQPGAEEAFKILGHAFELIGNPEKRRDYDSHMEKEDTENAMQEFADLLTKLHEKLQEASNLLRCDHCGGKHKRVATDRPMYSARFCERCRTRHSAKEGDVWAESTMLGFLWHYYACMEGKVYDITEWASCKSDNFKSMQANSHQVIYRLSSGGKAKGNTTRSGDANFEDFLNNLLQTASGGGDGPTVPTQGQSTAVPPTKPTKTTRRKKKKH